MDLRDASTYHRLTLQAEGRSPETQRHYALFERLFIDYLDEKGLEANLDAITPANVRAAADWYRARVRPSSLRDGGPAVRTFVMRIKTFAKFLENENVLPPGTLDRVRPPKVPKYLRSPFTTNELAQMWAATRQSAFPARDEALFLLLLDTGMRIGEAATLTLSKLQLDQGRVIVGAKGKGRRERIVPLGDSTEPDGGRAIHALRAYLSVRPVPEAGEASQRVFLTRDGKLVESEGLSLAIQRAGELAAVPNPIPYRLRHSYATIYLTQHPGDEMGLREVLGHISHDVLADYVHLAHSEICQRHVSIADTLTPPPPIVERAPRPPRQRKVAVGVIDPGSVPDLVRTLLGIVRSDDGLRHALLDALTSAA